MKKGLHQVLYRFSPDDYKQITEIWNGEHPEDGSPLTVQDGPPEGFDPPDLDALPQLTAPVGPDMDPTSSSTTRRSCSAERGAGAGSSSPPPAARGGPPGARSCWPTATRATSRRGRGARGAPVNRDVRLRPATPRAGWRRVRTRASPPTRTGAPPPGPGAAVA
jgi:hypothetical protein